MICYCLVKLLDKLKPIEFVMPKLLRSGVDSLEGGEGSGQGAVGRSTLGWLVCTEST